MKVNELFILNGRIAVITGGAGLLGQKHAEAILESGGRAILFDIQKARLDECVAELQKRFPKKVWGFEVNITSEVSIRTAVARVEKDIGPIDILINNAANNPKVESGDKSLNRLETIPLDIWNEDIAVGLTGAFLVSRVIGSTMAKRGRGAIVNVASDLGIIAPDQRIYAVPGLEKDQQPTKPITYSVVKHGLIGLTKYLATYWADAGIRVNAISPGGVSNNQPESFVKKLENLIPLNRMARTDEYKGAILFLCSDASSYMTGANLVIDGGRTVW